MRSPTTPGLGRQWHILTLWALSTRDVDSSFAPDDVDEDWLQLSRLGSADDTVRVAASIGQTATEVARRFASGAELAALCPTGELTCSGWVSRSRTWIGEIATWFTPAYPGAYVWDCATKPVYRGRGYYTALLRLIARRLGRLGVDVIWIGAEWSNWQSIHGIVRVGFQPVAAVVAFCVDRYALRHVIDNPGASSGLCRSLRAALSTTVG